MQMDWAKNVTYFTNNGGINDSWNTVIFALDQELHEHFIGSTWSAGVQCKFIDIYFC